ncbi:MAG: hypothetical protein IPL97_12425 [Niastella sp.]|nr:hypothetical protein [Niastella sp.]
MKLIITLLLSLCITVISFGQARTGTADYQKVSRAAILNDMPFPAKTVENALIDNFLKKGYKSSSSKGFTVFKGVRLTELGPDSYDLYFSAERVSRRDKDNSTLTLLISKGFDAFINEADDATLITNAVAYMNGLRDVVAAYDLEQQIADQENAVKKAEKKDSNLKDEAEDLQKKKSKIESDIARNIKDKADQEKEVANQKQILETLKAKRKIN